MIVRRALDGVDVSDPTNERFRSLDVESSLALLRYYIRRILLVFGGLHELFRLEEAGLRD